MILLMFLFWDKILLLNYMFSQIYLFSSIEYLILWWIAIYLYIWVFLTHWRREIVIFMSLLPVMRKYLLGNSEVFTTEFYRNLQWMFSLCYMHNDAQICNQSIGCTLLCYPYLQYFYNLNILYFKNWSYQTENQRMNRAGPS